MGRSAHDSTVWLLDRLPFEFMPLAPVEEGGVRIVEGPPQEPVMRCAQDATLVIEACFSAHVRKALLYSENLTPEFFDLSSGQAGEVLEKFRRFRMRVAIVCAPGAVQFSTRFLEIVSDDLRVFETRAQAWEWLVK